MGKLITIAVAFLIALVAIYNTEFMQKKIFDVKADYLGTDRTITFYAPVSGTKIKSYSDKDTRVDLEKQGEISVWLGEKKKKVISNLPYILEDN